MWITKKIYKLIYSNAQSKLAPRFTPLKASYTHKSFNPWCKNPPSSKSVLSPYMPKSTILSPSSPPSILGTYVSKSTSTPSSKSKNLKSTCTPQLHYASRCVLMLILIAFPATNPKFFQHPSHYPKTKCSHHISLLQYFTLNPYSSISPSI